MVEYVTYYRVSTDKQGRSGLGLEAQQNAVSDFIGNIVPLEEFTEIESGKKADRPELLKALALCKKRKARLVIAKLDRLSRNVAFIANLMDSKADFVACDMPEANKLTIHILAAVAEHEREMISQRTKVALQAAKARGVKLGSPNPEKGSKVGVVQLTRNADRFAYNVVPIIHEIQAAGVKTYRGIAQALNARGIQTARGGDWHPATVRNIVNR
ncbi:resolvase [Alphaproteobacteria bacterium 46_93_T64]|nr:resolvase [Alphaproteobacteria bacterium 46_93_T64]